MNKHMFRLLKESLEDEQMTFSLNEQKILGRFADAIVKECSNVCIRVGILEDSGGFDSRVRGRASIDCGMCANAIKEHFDSDYD